MSRKLAILLAIIVMVVLGSCVFGGERMFSDDDKYIDERFGQMIECIKNQDEDALSSMFSAQALTQSVDFENRITNMFEIIQGDIVSWERTGGPGVSEGKNDDGSGRVWKEIRATYDLNTSENKYHISLQEITKCSSDTDKVGVSSFCIVKTEDWDEEYNYWGALGLPEDFETLGIFVDTNKSTP